MKRILFTIAALLFVGCLLPLRAQVGPDIVWATNAHSDLIKSVAFSADSTRVASGGGDQQTKIWTTTSNTLVRGIMTLNAPVLSTALSSDGSLLATGSSDGRTRMWRVSDGVRLWTDGLDGRVVSSLCFSPDDSLVSFGRSDGIQVRYASSGGGFPFGPPPPTDVSDVRFSPDGTTVASANDNFTATLWHLPEGTVVTDLVGHSNVVNSVDFSPDGKLIATASADGTARIWNTTNGASLLVIDGGGGVARFSADGRLLYTYNGTFKIWRVSNGTCAGSIVNSGAVVFDIAKNGKYLAYGRNDAAVVLARTPVVIDEFSRTGNQTILHWQGGTGLYQLQSTTNFPSWQNVGTATTNQFATNISSSTLFFRVQSLPNP